MFRLQFLIVTVSILFSTTNQQFFDRRSNFFKIQPRSKDSVVIAVTNNDPHNTDQEISLRRIKTNSPRIIDFITPLFGGDRQNDGTTQDSSVTPLDSWILNHFGVTSQDTQSSSLSNLLHSPHSNHHDHHHSDHDKLRQLFFILVRDQPALAPLLAPIVQAAMSGAGAGSLASPVSPVSSASFAGFGGSAFNGALSDDVSQNMQTNIDPVVAQSFLTGILSGLQNNLGTTGALGSASTLSDSVPALNYMRPSNIQLDDTGFRPTSSNNRRPYGGSKHASKKKPQAMIESDTNEDEQPEENAAGDEDFILIGDTKAHQYRTRKILKKFGHKHEPDVDVVELYEPLKKKQQQQATTVGFNMQPWSSNTFRLRNFETIDDIFFSSADFYGHDIEKSERALGGTEYNEIKNVDDGDDDMDDDNDDSRNNYEEDYDEPLQPLHQVEKSIKTENILP